MKCEKTPRENIDLEFFCKIQWIPNASGADFSKHLTYSSCCSCYLFEKFLKNVVLLSALNLFSNMHVKPA